MTRADSSFLAIVFALRPVLYIAFAVLGFLALSRLFTFQTRLSCCTVADIQELLGPSNTSLQDMLIARAIPNQRLVSAFGITNTFVSHDINTHRAFRNQATSFIHELLRNPRRGWASWASEASGAARLQLLSSSPKLPFDRFIQSVTFRVVILGLLNPTLEPTSFIQSEVDFITSSINSLWDQSKNSQCEDPVLLDRLKSTLRAYLPDEETFPNPLDFIIPTWESLWRVVAIALAHIHCDQPMQSAFIRFLHDPSNGNFDQRLNSQPSVEDFIVETLRLYPPTKRIARTLPKRIGVPWIRSTSHFLGLLAADVDTRIVADIETVQRSQIWSSSDTAQCAGADVFDATRHRYNIRSQTDAYMPFGYGRLGCVAKDWAPMAAALIVGAVVEEMDLEAYELVAGEKVGGRTGWEGWIIRKRACQGVQV
ncbi:hypothetical protein HWV62_15761 [Athelia sp. TMB]|nr:hypothetical protein HWV62_15761 [Athelia sp. TMB]